MLLRQDTATGWQHCTYVFQFLSWSYCVNIKFVPMQCTVYVSVDVFECILFHLQCLVLSIYRIILQFVHDSSLKSSTATEALKFNRTYFPQQTFSLMCVHCSFWFFHTDLYTTNVTTKPSQFNKSSTVQSVLLSSQCFI